MKIGKTGKGLLLAVTALATGAMALFLGACGENSANNEEHIHDYTARREIVTEAKCNQEGLARDYCACGDSKEVKLDKTEHSFQVSEEESVAPTCTKEGTTVEICSVCGERKVTGHDKLGHDFGEWETVTEPTTTSKGLKKRTCQREGCDGEETEDIPMIEATDKTDFVIKVQRSTGELFPASRGVRISVKNSAGEEILYSYAMSVREALDSNEEYDVEITNIPKGYTLEQTTYHITAENPNLTVTIPAAVITSSAPASTTYKVGSVMYDQTLNIVGLNMSDDRTVTISDLLKEYKAILINIYFKTCQGCLAEVDYLVNSYSMKSSTGNIYGDEVAMLMLGRSNTETKETMRRFKAVPNYAYTSVNVKSRDIPMMMAYCPALARIFEKSQPPFAGWPTTVIIDSEGVVIYMETAVARNPQHFTSQMDRGIEFYNRIHPEAKDSANEVSVAPEAILPEAVHFGERKEKIG